MAAGSLPTGGREIADRLRQGSVPRGEEFDAARRLLALSPAGPEAIHALRLLLEGAIADAMTAIEDTQAIMSMLKAWDRGDLRVDELLSPP